MKINWFVTETYGKEFLNQLLNNTDLDLYNIGTLKIIIEYFFQRFVGYLYKVELPIFLVQTILFVVQIFLNEHRLSSSKTPIPSLCLGLACILIQVIIQGVNINFAYTKFMFDQNQYLRVR